MASIDTNRFKTPDGNWVTPQELNRVLADEGYSGPDRKTFLTSLLTELAAQSAGDTPAGERAQVLIDEVRAILESEQAQNSRIPEAKDNL